MKIFDDMNKQKTLMAKQETSKGVTSDCRQTQPSDSTIPVSSPPTQTYHLPPTSSPSSSHFSPANENAFLLFDHFIEDVGASNFLGVEKGFEIVEDGLNVSGLSNQDVHSNNIGYS